MLMNTFFMIVSYKTSQAIKSIKRNVLPYLRLFNIEVVKKLHYIECCFSLVSNENEQFLLLRLVNS